MGMFKKKTASFTQNPDNGKTCCDEDVNLRNSMPFMGVFGGAPTPSPIGFNTFYDTISDQLFYVDLERNKWMSFATISESFGYNDKLQPGDLFKKEGNVLAETKSGIIPSWPSTLIGITGTKQNLSKTTLQFYDGIDENLGAQIAWGTSYSLNENLLNYDFSGISYLRNKISGLYIELPNVTVFYKYSYSL